MQRKKLLSACIAIALASPAWSAERVEEVDQSTQIGCPSDMDNLSDSERKGLPAECQRSNMAPWVALGVTSLATAIAITELAGDNDSHHHHSSTPPDDDNVIPPDDGGDVTPPDDGGNVTPPDDGGDVTPPDDGGDVTPPDDGGDVTPPDDGGDVTPPDDGGDVTPPVKFNNDIEWDKTKNTLTIRSVVFTYSQNSDGTYTLTSPDGKTVTVNDWQVDEANNTIQIDGSNAAVNIDWRYDDDGLLYITKKDTAVVNDDTHTLTIKVNDAVITDKGGNTVENGATVMDVAGNNITVNNDGESVVTGKDSIVAVLTGDYITINNNGNTIVDGGTASTITGDHATLNNHGDVKTTNGGTGASIEGNFATVDNIGNIISDGQGSVNTKITGNDAVVKQEGDLTVSGGAKGTVVTGNGAKITNKGKMSVTDADSVGIMVDGDNTFFSNTGDIDVSNSATGISINGDTGNIALAGNMNVGDLAVGLNVSGDNNKMALATNELNVTGQKAVGVNVTGGGNTIAITGNILVDKDETASDALTYFSDKSAGVNVNGDDNNITLDGSLTVVTDSEVTTRKGGQRDGSLESITGLAVTGDGNSVTLNGGIQLKGEVGQLADGTTVADKRAGYGASSIVEIDGHSSVYLNGDSTVSGDFPVGYSGLIQLSNGATLEIGEDATLNTQGVTSFEHFAVATPPVVYVQSGSLLTNNGDIDVSNMVFANVYNEGANAINNGNLTISQNSQDPMPSPAGFIALYGSSATNNGTITGKVMEQSSLKSKFSTGTSNVFLFNNDVSSITGMEAYSGSSASNGKNGIINMYGRGDVGMLAMSNSSVQNAGQITMDTLWVDENDTTQLSSDLASKDAIDYGTGMAVGTDGYGGTGSNASATNLEGGVITVYNAGAGMAAYGASNTVINQGTINLEKNENYDENLGANKYAGMDAYKGGTAINDKTGVINVDVENAVAMKGEGSSQLVNNGTINLGTSGTTQTGMIGMQLSANATADAVVENNGTINIYANDSYAFSILGSNGHVVNNGTVVIADGVTGSGLIMQGDSVNVEGINGNNGNSTEVHYANYSSPNVSGSDSSSASSGMNNLNGYVVGTSADGSAGKLKVSNASMDGVSVNTNFAAGTADTSVTFDNVVEGNNLTDAGAITSTSVVWSAQGSNDASGNVDVTMTKNAYTDVATDSSVNGVAQALDAGYTNNELYSSLNVGTTAELNSALKQISGSQATTVFREARVLSNRFSMLADAAPTMGNGLAFNVVAKGDPRAELGNDTQYDMMALRKLLALTESQNLSLEYGIARLDGDGSEKAGDNGVTGGYSQFFGLKHQMTFENGLNWNNGLRYDVHQLDSSRSVSYNGVNKTADTDVKQQYLEFRSEGAKTFTLSEGLKITPYAGVKLRHTLEDGYQERNAGDFNLNMNNGSETAVDSIVGMKLDYAGKNGWSASMTLEGGPNLSYAKSQRSATLAGAGSQRFDVDDGQKGGGINSLASVGVKYNVQDSAMHLDAYQWKEDGISDKGFMLSFKQAF